jgi:hypothetical protein
MPLNTDALSAQMIEIVKAELAAAEPGSAAAANFSNQLQQLLLESLPTEIARD